MEDSLEKIRLLKKSGDYDDEAIREFNKWERKIEESIAKSDLLDHFAIKDLLDLSQTRINGINNRLLRENSMSLLDTQRDLLIHERDWWQNLINIFTGATKEIKTIQSNLKDPYYKK